MKFTKMVETEIEADSIYLSVPVRYGEEDIPNNFPHRGGDMWKVVIDIETGKIADWPANHPAKFCMKVCDQGTYRLMRGNVIMATIEEDYVPSFFPGEHYGDYIDFDISSGGFVKGWGRKATQVAVAAAFFSDDD